MGTEELGKEGMEPKVSRRALIAGLVAATAIGKSEAAHSLDGRILTKAAELAALMQQRHGGQWHADIDHEEPPFLLIAPDLPGP